jgi:hypothetical protein
MGSGGSRSLWSPGKSCGGYPARAGVPPDGSRFAAAGAENCTLAHVAPLQTQNAWVLYGQASRAISTG